MLTEVAGLTNFFASMPYGDEWRAHRRMFQQHFSEKNLLRIRETEIDIIRKGLLLNLYQSPDEFDAHVRNCVGGLSISLTYGLPIERHHDPLVQYTENALVHGAAASAPVKYFVNIIPQLKYIPEWRMPGAHFKRVGRLVREELTELEEKPYQKSLDLIEAGATHRESFISVTLERHCNKPNFELQARCAKETAVQVFAAASETTVASTLTFILAMLKYPDVQRLAQEGVDSVVGPDRLPEFEDISRLHYVSAVIKEVLRWNPVLPAGVPHFASDEDSYRDYYISKDCIIIANA
ncbi:O-methylsterigmatocystin oxidoreductase [Leucoagaricus sp. SymC.cos]|nr:O-methylsterigmatocystin oxidoreductase [Leucoagaricus sp. SymC.cos]